MKDESTQTNVVKYQLRDDTTRPSVRNRSVQIDSPVKFLSRCAGETRGEDDIESLRICSGEILREERETIAGSRDCSKRDVAIAGVSSVVTLSAENAVVGQAQQQQHAMTKEFGERKKKKKSPAALLRQRERMKRFYEKKAKNGQIVL